MKVMLWICNEGNQRALAAKVHAAFPLAGVITESRQTKRDYSLKSLTQKVIEKVFLNAVGKAWWGMQLTYRQQYPELPQVPTLDVENINSDEAFQFTNNIQPDLILVSGTRLVKEKMLSIQPSIGILNLHTGLSPYIKGGPNCTNWCLATKQYHLIGNTIMWIDLGIDTGNILTTEFTPLNGNESLDVLHMKVMEHAHDLYVRAVRYLSTGQKQSVPQKEIAKGTTYYTKQWTLQQKFALTRNFKGLQPYYQSGKLETDRIGVKTISLP